MTELVWFAMGIGCGLMAGSVIVAIAFGSRQRRPRARSADDGYLRRVQPWDGSRRG